MTDRNGCRWPGCPRPVPEELWGCKAHWKRLPAALRDAISLATRALAIRVLQGKQSPKLGVTLEARRLQSLYDEAQLWIRHTLDKEASE